MADSEWRQIINKCRKDRSRVLDLSGKGLTELPREIGQLSNLTELFLSDNQLTELPKEIGQLSNLTKLYLMYNQLTELPKEIGQLSNLTKLYLQINQLTELPKEIGQLSNLTSLDLSYNQLTELPREIGQLSNLAGLSLSGNELTELPKEIGQLSNLTELSLYNNQLTELPKEVGQLSNLTTLDLRGNQLPIPPEIIGRADSPAEIINYYLQHHRTSASKKSLNEAKMIIVGQGDVGKTSVVRRLVGDPFDEHESKTKGIDITRWGITANGASIRLNIWDFGGQEIMHATHQFFLTKRSLYLLVLDSRMDERENHLEYWLKIIQSFGADSPVIVVCNKSDEHELDLDWRGLQQKYPTIKAFVSGVSCKNGEGISELQSIIEREVAHLNHIHDELLLSWFEVKDQLEGMKEDHIPYCDYQKMCQEKNITDNISQRTLIGFLHDLGIVLHFHDHPILDDVNVLNPEWVTKGVYRILNSPELFRQKGVLEIEALNRILAPQAAYPGNKHMFIIGMMRKFELCFDFEGYPDKRFLVPELLSKEEPDTGEWADSLAFQYQYNVLPGSVISRFIVRMHKYISQNTYWRTGVVLAYKNRENRALVKADIEEKKIFISVIGTNQTTRRNFLEVIRADFERIHATIPKIEAREKVPIPGHSEVVVDYQHLCVLEKKGIDTFIPEGLEEEVIVKELLNGIKNIKNNAEKTREEVGQECQTIGRDQTSLIMVQ